MIEGLATWCSCWYYGFIGFKMDSVTPTHVYTVHRSTQPPITGVSSTGSSKGPPVGPKISLAAATGTCMTVNSAGKSIEITHTSPFHHQQAHYPDQLGLA